MIHRKSIQVPLQIVEGISASITIRYENNWTDDDIEVLLQRIKETVKQERTWLEAQAKGELPGRKPVGNPCGCGGAGS